MRKPTDKAQSKPDKNQSSIAERDERHFWRALKNGDDIQTLHEVSPAANAAHPEPEPSSPKAIDLTADLSDLSPAEQEDRRKTLRSMLAASEERHQGAIRARRPTPEAGLRVGVRGGPHNEKEGIILDADYIQSRVLLDLEDGQDAQWIGFARLRSLDKD